MIHFIKEVIFTGAAFETMQKNVIHIHQSFETFYRIFEVQSDIEYEKFIREES